MRMQDTSFQMRLKYERFRETLVFFFRFFVQIVTVRRTHCIPHITRTYLQADEYPFSRKEILSISVVLSYWKQNRKPTV